MKEEVTLGSTAKAAFVDFVIGCANPFNFFSHDTRKYQLQTIAINEATAGARKASNDLRQSLKG